MWIMNLILPCHKLVPHSEAPLHVAPDEVQPWREGGAGGSPHAAGGHRGVKDRAGDGR